MRDEEKKRTETMLDKAAQAMRDMAVPDGPSPEELRTVLATLIESTAVPKKRSIIQRIRAMKPRTRIAAGAVLIAIVVLAGVFSLTPQQSAYALEQTAAALKTVRYMHIVRRDEDGQVTDERWIEIGPDGFQARYRQDTPPDFLVVEDGKTVARYYKANNTVVLYDAEDKGYTWISDPGGLFQDLAGPGSAVVQKNAEYQGRRAHHVRWLALNMDAYIDPESKLPIFLGGYQISYEDPPEGTFDIAIPDSFTVVDKRPGAPASEEPEWLQQKAERERTAVVKFKEARGVLAAGQELKAEAVAELSKAADLLHEVVDLWPGLNWAWFWLGRAHYELAEYDAAIEALSRVLDMFADSRVVPHYCYLARALAYRGKGMAKEGRKDLGKALPTMIGALRNIEGATMFDYADDPLYRDHGDRRPSPEQSLTRMIERLRQVTGQNFGYDPVATPEQKQQAISAWENWWKEHAADYGVSEP